MEDKLKYTCHLFYKTKGYIASWILDMDDEEIDNMNGSYMSRLWDNEEGYLHEEGFDEAWVQFKKEQQID